MVRDATLQALFDNVIDGVYLHRDGRVLFANTTIARMLGAPSPEALIGRRVVDGIHPDDRPTAVARMAVAAAGPEAVPPMDIRALRDDGTTLHVETTGARAMFDGSPAVLVFLRDVTVRRRLEALEVHTNAVLEAVATGHPIQDTLQQIIDLYVAQNPGQLCDIRTFDPEGRRDRRTPLPSISPDRPVGRPASVSPDGEVIRVERIRDPSVLPPAAAALRTRAMWSFPVVAAQGRIVGSFIVYVAHDRGPRSHEAATLRRLSHLAGIAIGDEQWRRQLIRSDARYRTLVEQIPEAVFRTDPSGRWSFVGGAWTALTGISATDAVGQSAVDTFHPDDRNSVAALFSASGTAGSRSSEARITGAGGQVRLVEIRANHIPEGEGGGGVTGIITDITDRKGLETQLVANERLLSMGELAASVLHDINNPLAALALDLDSISLEIDECARAMGAPASMWTTLREIVAEARRAGDHVRDVAADLMLFSRAEAMREPASMDARPAIEVALRLARNDLRHRASIERRFGDIGPVLAEHGRLVQVLLNVLVNAAHALPVGRATDNRITVTTRQEFGTVVIEVQDTGSGMPPEVLARAFEPFFTTKPPGVGSGLGLAICRRIVEGMGGTIVATSAIGIGTTVRIALPTARPTEPHPVQRRASGGAARRVLLVDDDPNVGSALLRALRTRHTVDLANSGARALALLAAGRTYDVVLTDVMMPEMSGIELHGHLARDYPGLAKCTVFMTGGTFTVDARLFLERCGQPKITKPFYGEEVFAAIEQIVTRSEARRSAPREGDR